jgi:transposase
MEEKQPSMEVEGIPEIRHRVGGTDLHSERHWICAPSVDGKKREVKVFGATTVELMRLAGWLKQRRVESIAMESTGVYWIAPFELLKGQGFEVRWWIPGN